MKKPEDNKENFSICICPDCAMYSGCNSEKKEKLFCARTRSACQMDSRKMCICGRCPVYAENNLSGAYFCISELEE